MTWHAEGYHAGLVDEKPNAGPTSSIIRWRFDGQPELFTMPGTVVDLSASEFPGVLRPHALKSSQGKQLRQRYWIK
jgi:hypothetical protein